MRSLMRRQQKGAAVALKQSEAGDLAVVVDGAGFGENPAGVWRKQGVEVGWLAVLPERCTFERRSLRRSGDLTR